MSAQTALLAVLIGFIGGISAVATTQLWRDGRRRRVPRWSPAGERRDRLPPGVERLLRAAIRFERFVSWRGPTWRSALLEDERERARELIDELDEEAGIAEATLRLEGAVTAVRHLQELRAAIARFRLAVAGASAGSAGGVEEVGLAAGSITASLPDLKDVLLAHLAQGATPRREAPAPALAGHLSRERGGAERGGWMAALEPLRHTAFRWLWLASLASQLGTWIQNVGAVDLMTLLAPTALLLALVQTASSLPGLFLALPAGALADIVDRRRLLLLASAWMCGVSALLTAMTFAHVATWWGLLALTFALGLGTVAGLPAWQAVIPDLVPRAGLTPAVTLSSVAINLARAIGPALGGLAVALAGPGAAFALTAAAFAFTALVVAGWRRDVAVLRLPAEGMAAAVWSGIRYSLRAAPVRVVLVRAAGFSLFASALWALMPVVSRQLEHGSLGYGGLLGSLGVGAVAGALLLTDIRRALRPDALMLVACLAFAGITLAAGLVPVYAAALALMAAGGLAWVCAISTFNVAAQRAAPRWMRGRVLASYQVAYMGSMAVGSAMWGAVAGRLGTGPTLVAAAALLAVSSALALRWRLSAVESPDPPRPRGVVITGEAAQLPPAPAAPVAALPPPPPTSVLLGAGGYDLTGRRLGSYRLEAAIGDGPLGRVYRARRVDLDLVRAVKVVQSDVADDPGFRERFLRGARAASGLHHPHIVSVRDAGVEHGIQYVAMDHVESMTLAERLNRMPAERALGDAVIRRCVREVAAALDHAHARGVVHRGLKPSNILVRASDGHAFVTDFGTGDARGSVYLSPEQWEGLDEPTAASDVYAFAAILYEIATGDPPLGRVLATIADRMGRPLPAPAPALAPPDLPSALGAVLSRGLAPSPASRYATAGDLAAAYLEVTEPSARAALPVPAPRGPSPLARRVLPGGSGRVLAPATAVVLGAGVLLGVTLGLQRPSPAGTTAVAAPALPAPAAGAIGEPIVVGGLRLTVLSVDLDARPPAALALDAGDRFVSVQILYEDGGPRPAIVSPYDWALTDPSGAVYAPVQDGLDAALAERELPSRQSARGLVGFEVPRTAQGLVLRFGTELGDEAAEIPLP